MPGAVGETSIKISGLRETITAFRQIDRKLPRVIQDALKSAAKPVADRAHQLAVDNISHIGADWSRMRVGASASTVYVAPAARRKRGSPRPNLGVLLLEQSLLPAVDEMLPEITERVEAALDELTSSEF